MYFTDLFINLWFVPLFPLLHSHSLSFIAIIFRMNVESSTSVLNEATESVVPQISTNMPFLFLAQVYSYGLDKARYISILNPIIRVLLSFQLPSLFEMASIIRLFAQDFLERRSNIFIRCIYSGLGIWCGYDDFQTNLITFLFSLNFHINDDTV